MLRTHGVLVGVMLVSLLLLQEIPVVSVTLLLSLTEKFEVTNKKIFFSFITKS